MLRGDKKEEGDDNDRNDDDNGNDDNNNYDNEDMRTTTTKMAPRSNTVRRLTCERFFVYPTIMGKI